MRTRGMIAMVVVLLCGGAQGSFISLSAPNFYADDSVVVASDGFSAEISEHPVYNTSLLSNDPGLGDTEVIFAAPGRLLLFDYVFRPGNESVEFGAYLLDTDGDSLGAPYEFYLTGAGHQTLSGTVSFDLTDLMHYDYVGIQFQLYSSVYDSSSLLTIRNLRLSPSSVIPEPGSLFVFGSGLTALVLRRKYGKKKRNEERNRSLKGGAKSWGANALLFIVLLGIASGANGAYFHSPASFPSGEQSVGVCGGDFTGAGLMDLAVANTGRYASASQSIVGRALRFFALDAAGSFYERQTISLNNVPLAVAAADLNGNGLSDLVLATDAGIRVYLSTISGFVANGPFACGAVPLSIAVTDLDGDGVPDIVTANNGGDSISILFGNGDGSFGAAMNYPTGSAPVRVRVGEFNGDGLPDLAVLNNFSGTLSILLGLGNRLFDALEPLQVPALPRALAIGRFSGNGYDDIAVGNYPGGEIALLRGDGTGRFSLSRTLRVNGGVTDLCARDINNNGSPEIIATTNRSEMLVCSEIDGSYQVTETYPVTGVPASLAPVDLGQQEGIALASYFDGEVSVLLREKGEDGEGETLYHSADWNGAPDNRIDLSELLRLIQFYNSGGLHCADKSDLQSEDGYLPGLGAKLDCIAHASDYNPQDWAIDLSELLRAIQFYNSGGYHACTGSEDGFCPGLIE